jgi:hypothetical protein
MPRPRAAGSPGRIALALAALMSVTACDAPVAEVSYQPLAVPFAFKVDSNGELSTEVSQEIATPIGKFGIEVGASIEAQEENPDASLILVVRTVVNAREVENIWRVNQGKELIVKMNGEITAEVSRDTDVATVRLIAAPGATIEVAEKGSTGAAAKPPEPYRLYYPQWEFTLPDSLANNHAVDLDGQLSAHVEKIDSEYADMYWRYGDGLEAGFSSTSLGSTTLADPTPEQCRADAESNAVGRLPAEEVRTGLMFCAVTTENNVAWLKITSAKGVRPDRYALRFTAKLWMTTKRD